MKKILILGGPIGQIPFIKKAKEMGLYTAVVDLNPDAPGIKFADEYFKCSLLDKEGVLKIAEKFAPDGISCGASDVGVLTLSFITTKMGLPGIKQEIAINVKDKGVMIECFSNNKVAHPLYKVLNQSASVDIRFPLIVKPVDRSGSCGIHVARNSNEFKNAVEDSLLKSITKQIIVEEYMEGPEVSVEICVLRGKPYVIQVTDKITSGEPNFIEIGHSQPSQLGYKNVLKIKKLAKKAVRAVGLENGCAHAEIKFTKDGPKMVEIAGRLGGDMISTELVFESTGFDMAKYEIEHCLGLKLKKPRFKNKSFVAVRFIQTKAGKLINYNPINIEKNKRYLIDYSFDGVIGHNYQKPLSNSDRLGYVVMRGKTQSDALAHCDEVINELNIVFSEVSK